MAQKKQNQKKKITLPKHMKTPRQWLNDWNTKHNQAVQVARGC